jgi:hypothetical protein
MSALGKSMLAAALLLGTAAPAAAEEDRQTLDRAIRLIREAQGAVAAGRDDRGAELLDRARDRLAQVERDRDVRAAIEQLDRARGALGESWRSPADRTREVRRAGDRAIARIRQSRAYAAEGSAGARAARVALGTFLKRTFDPETFRAGLAAAAEGRAFSRLILVVSPGERELTPILNTVQVRVRGEWVEQAIRHRTQAGENDLAVAVPSGATEIQLSLDHGKGARLDAYLE